MGQKVKVSKTVNSTVEETTRKVVSAVKELGFELETLDSRNGTVKFTKKGILGHCDYNYQCIVFDMGDGSTMCTIQTAGYGPNEYPWFGWLDSIRFGANSRKYSQMILDRL